MENDVTTLNCSEILLKPKNVINNAKGTLKEVKTKSNKCHRNQTITQRKKREACNRR